MLFISENIEFIFLLTLMIIVGFEVISNVPAVLHTPLMSGANAIHGVVIVGAIIVMGQAESDDYLALTLGFLAVILGTLNVVGGFVVTDRMLEMFKRKRKISVRYLLIKRNRKNMSSGFLALSYLIGSVSFIMGLKMLSHPETARKGNLYAGMGMTLAIFATIFLYKDSDGNPLGNYLWIFGGLAIGTVLGNYAAKR